MINGEFGQQDRAGNVANITSTINKVDPNQAPEFVNGNSQI